MAREFGDYLKTLRTSLAETQTDMALKLGKSPSYISQLERGAYNPSQEFVRDLVERYDLDPAVWLGRAGYAWSGVDEKRREREVPTAVGREDEVPDVLRSWQHAWDLANEWQPDFRHLPGFFDDLYNVLFRHRMHYFPLAGVIRLARRDASPADAADYIRRLDEQFARRDGLHAGQPMIEIDQRLLLENRRTVIAALRQAVMRAVTSHASQQTIRQAAAEAAAQASEATARRIIEQLGLGGRETPAQNFWRRFGARWVVYDKLGFALPGPPMNLQEALATRESAEAALAEWEDMVRRWNPGTDLPPVPDDSPL